MSIQGSKENVIPRPEYPRPQMVRDSWINLNGIWEFEIDHGKSGRARKIYERKLESKILVPFCPESKLSGIEYKDFMAAVWYKREFDIPDEWMGKRVLIHFGAVDYETEVWINGVSAGKHRGGYTSFSFDITGLIKPGTNVVVVCAEDDVRSGLQPKGKQSSEYYSHGCDYTRTTGIWQTVWLECVPQEYISSFKIIPDPENECVYIETYFEGDTDGYTIEGTALYDGKKVGYEKVSIGGKTARFCIKLSEIHLWEPGSPELYDLELVLCKDEEPVDSVKSYFGLRSVILGKNAILINGKPVFQRLVLDQGFYPDGIYTAPSDEDLKRDIEISMELGFNGARLHQKVFEPRFLYWADKLGYLVWGEYGSWGLNITTPMGLERFLPEWLEAVERDFNHPSIIGWCPFNETWDLNGTRQDDEVLRIVYNVTKAIDKTRPVIDTSGNFHVATDVFDIHDYEQNPEVFRAKFEPMKNGGEVYVTFPDRQKYQGQPYFVSEYGGIWWSPGNDKGWGYGQRPASEQEFMERYKGLTEALLSNPAICGFCYTQLYDIEQEVNGLYTYDRKPKFDVKAIYAINSQKAAIEE
ncbi:Glycosyl hydrolases family 2 [Caldanaerobius fijiensis DSM 17918]|uniref:Glycosyl hydrolases family 2 n=1 Tax=Caldanaerobius fijiensis DSM 17918 TaxID=1121256 RepID=A0A1M5BEF5_9THEO|nr:sugar-binding domain-containing protein [Caldanaerobius fijiensis]SHF40884.1 Glycosyl hydrolases family 2 [Caldanaerobius fijiensis DSM 17918]